MPLRKLLTRSNGKHHTTLINYREVLTVNHPLKSLTRSLKKHSGRNNTGRITTRHQGGGHKRRYRIIDFKRDKDNVWGTVKTIEYDPNRSAFISLISYQDGEKRYIVAPHNLPVGAKVISGTDGIDIQIGNCTEVGKMPDGTFVHNVELQPHKGAQIIRSAGSKAQILGKDETGRYTILKLSSGEIRKVLNGCRAVVGIVSNGDHNNVILGKAGRSRYLGIRPTVRGSAMNPNDHPHGGGEGRSPVGYDAPRTPWGKRHMGVVTRSRKKNSTRLIIKRRPK